jgi:excisionase family DNA binding protein
MVENFDMEVLLMKLFRDLALAGCEKYQENIEKISQRKDFSVGILIKGDEEVQVLADGRCIGRLPSSLVGLIGGQTKLSANVASIRNENGLLIPVVNFYCEDKKKKAPPEPEPERLLTVKQVAERLALDESTVYKWADEGRIPYVDLGKGKKRCLRFKLEHLMALVESRTVDNGNLLQSAQGFVINKGKGVAASPRKGGQDG